MISTRKIQRKPRALGSSGVNRMVMARIGVGVAALVGAITLAFVIAALPAAAGTPGQPLPTGATGPASTTGTGGTHYSGLAPGPTPTPIQTAGAGETGCCG